MSTHSVKNGQLITVDCPTIEDAAALIAYSKIVFASTDQVLNTLAEYTISVKDEERWIQSMNENPGSFVLVARLNGNIVGMLFFVSGNKIKNKHTGEFGVNVHPDFQSLFIGRILVQRLIDWAQHHPQIEKIFLTVFHTNERAIRLYQSLGFKEEGRHVKAAKQPSGEYVDVIQMYLAIK